MVNLLLGIFASLVAWLAINHALRPRIEVSAFISEVPRDTDRQATDYRIKVVNPRRRRVLADLTFDAAIRIPGPFSHAPNNVAVLDLPIHDLEDGLGGLHGGGGRLLRLDLVRLSAGARAIDVLSDAIVQELRSEVIGLRELLALHPEATVRLSIGMADGYSGLRRVVMHHYGCEDVLPYHFDSKSVAQGLPAGEAHPPKDEDSEAPDVQ